MLKTTLIECSKSATHQKNTYFYAQYNRISSRRGKNRAAIAIAHAMLTIIYNILKNNLPYYELGSDFFEQQRKNQIVQKSIKRLKDLGYSITVEEILSEA